MLLSASHDWSKSPRRFFSEEYEIVKMGQIWTVRNPCRLIGSDPMFMSGVPLITPTELGRCSGR